MSELELVGLHDDGEHVVLAGPDGARFRLRIDEPLRAAVRRDRPQLEQLRTEGPSPREIQAAIRAGASAQEVAHESGLTVEHVQRYEGPVLAEREYVADQARATRVGRDAGAPVLGDLVTDRLAARGVDLDSLAWDAARNGSGPWTVLARFAVDGETREARWTFDASRRAVVADEDEARWLSETEIADEPIPRRHLAAVRDVVFDVEADGVLRPSPHEQWSPPEQDQPEEPADDPQERTASLLDALQNRRGVRQSVELDDGEGDEHDGEEFEGFGPQHTFDFARLEAEVPGAHPVDADPRVEARVLPTLVPDHRSSSADDGRDEEPADEPETPVAIERGPERPAARSRARKGRAKVPSWDEIVFGAKPE